MEALNSSGFFQKAQIMIKKQNLIVFPDKVSNVYASYKTDECRKVNSSNIK